GHRRIKQPARLEDVVESELRHRLRQARGLALGNKSACAMTADDKRLKLHNSQSLANGRPADMHSSCQFPLGWESVAWLQFSLPQIRRQPHHYIFMQRAPFYFSQSISHGTATASRIVFCFDLPSRTPIGLEVRP